MRLFIALEFEEISDYLKQLQEKIPKVKSTYPNKFHLTLKFLGEVSEDKAEEVKEKLKKIDFSRFTAKLGKLGVFPNEKFIRVVWVGLEDGKKIEELQKNIEGVLSDLFGKDKKFHPHITLARIKFIEDDKKEEFVEAATAIEVEPKETEIKVFKLIKSTLTPEGPVYEDICVFEAKPL